MNKQELKHHLRDDLIEIGIAAIEHAKHLIQLDAVTVAHIDRLIALIREKDSAKIAAEITKMDRFRQDVVNKKKPDRPYTVQTCLLVGTESLIKIALSEKWLSGSAINMAFVGAWNGASCVDDENGDRGKTLENAETKYQDSVLYPQIEAAFEKVRDAEARLKKQTAA